MDNKQLQQLMAASLQSRVAATNNSSASSAHPAGVQNNNLNNNHSNKNTNALFPYVLHGLLQDLEKIGSTGVISWNPDGKSFRLQNGHLFASTLLKTYFSHMGEGALGLMNLKIELKAWGFEALDNGRYMHPCFQRDDASMCRFLRRGEDEVLNEEPRVHQQVRLRCL